MKLTDNVKIVFKNTDGKTENVNLTVQELLDKTTEDFYEMLDEKYPCNSSGCNNESQNFCDCGSSFDDYEISEVLFV